MQTKFFTVVLHTQQNYSSVSKPTRAVKRIYTHIVTRTRFRDFRQPWPWLNTPLLLKNIT